MPDRITPTLYMKAGKSYTGWGVLCIVGGGLLLAVSHDADQFAQLFRSQREVPAKARRKMNHKNSRKKRQNGR